MGTSNCRIRERFLVWSTGLILGFVLLDQAAAQPAFQFQEVTVENTNVYGLQPFLTTETNSQTWTSANASNSISLLSGTGNVFNSGDTLGDSTNISAFGTGNANFEFENSVSISGDTINSVGRSPRSNPPSAFHHNSIDGSAFAESTTSTTVKYTNSGQSGNPNAIFTLAPTSLGEVTIRGPAGPGGIIERSTRAETSFEILVGPDENNLTRIASGFRSLSNQISNGFINGDFFDSRQYTQTRRRFEGDPVSGPFELGDNPIVTARTEFWDEVDLQLALGPVDANEDLVIRYNETAVVAAQGFGSIGCIPNISSFSCDPLPSGEPQQSLLLSSGEFSLLGFPLPGLSVEDSFFDDSLSFGVTPGITFARTGDPFVLDPGGPGGGGGSPTSFFEFGGDGSNSVPEPNGFAFLFFSTTILLCRRRVAKP